MMRGKRGYISNRWIEAFAHPVIGYGRSWGWLYQGWERERHDWRNKNCAKTSFIDFGLPEDKRLMCVEGSERGFGIRKIPATNDSQDSFMTKQTLSEFNPRYLTELLEVSLGVRMTRIGRRIPKRGGREGSRRNKNA